MKSTSQKQNRSIPVTLAVAAAAAILGTAGPLHADSSLQNNLTIIQGPIQVRLAYTDKNGLAQDYAFQQLPTDVLNALPSGVLQLRGSPAPGSGGSALAQSQGSPNGYFDQLWGGVRDSVCGDAIAAVGHSLNDPSYQPYNFNCQTAPTGVLYAIVANSWTDQFNFTNTGARLHLDYDVPVNAVSFSLTTPNTCSSSSLFCQADPKFTVIFEVHLIVNADTRGANSIVLPPVTSHAGSAVVQNVIGGDQTQAVIDSWKQFINSYIAGGDISPAALAQQFGQFLVGLADIGITGILNQGVRDMVSSKLNLASSAAGSAALDASRDFDALYADLHAGQAAGFRVFAVSAGADGSLIFRVTYPAPGKPGVHNKLLDLNAAPSIILPSISVSLPQVRQGDKVQVLGAYFPAAYATKLVIDWDRTVPTATAQTELRWGPKGGPIADQTTNQFSFQADNLKPNTFYSFQVRECDAITCSPLSDLLSTPTQASDVVSFWLDGGGPIVIRPGPMGGIAQGGVSNVIGTAIDGADGAFAGFATIPLDTTPGSHTMNAALNSAGANTPIVVCPASGCQPALGVVGAGGGIEPAGSEVWISNPVRVKGSAFTAGQTVTVSIDNPVQQSIATTTVASDGTFDTTFTMPAVTIGSHTLTATEIINSRQVRGAGGITITLPGQTALKAAVSVFVAEAPR